MRRIPPGWRPHPQVYARLHRDYGKEIDLDLTVERFRLYHQEGQTARNWDARFSAWVIGDTAKHRERERGGTDELGTPHHQHLTTVQPLQPGDEGYLSIEELHDIAIRTTQPKE